MSKRKKPFEYLLPDRVSHDEYQREVKKRILLDRLVAVFFLISGFLAVSSVVLSILTAKWGEYTGHIGSDLVVFFFIFGTGAFCLYKGRFLWTTFLCRFCLSKVPEGSTYCPSCESDLLSNSNPQVREEAVKNSKS
jgi:hypothetical protein